MIATKTKSPPSFAWLEHAMAEIAAGELVSATGVPWSVYVRVADSRDVQRPRMKITFDRGRIEIMSPLVKHEQPHFRLGVLVLTLAEALGLELRIVGATTLRNEEREKGLEADESFYIAHANEVLGLDHIDLTKCPPPDLAIEIDLTSSSVSKEAIYGSIGVPEIWRHDDDEIVIRHRQADGTYQTATRSLSFPIVAAADLSRILVETNDMGEVAFHRHCRAWAETLVPPAANP
jgi:Uma2 family endonuclease